MGTIKLLNTNRQTSVTIRAFDGDEITLPSNQKEAIPVDEKFNWMLPPGVRDMTKGAQGKNRDLTADPDKDGESKPVVQQNRTVVPPDGKQTAPTSGATDKLPAASTATGSTADNTSASPATSGNR